MLLQIAVQVLLSFWNGVLFNAVERRDTSNFLRLTDLFFDSFLRYPDSSAIPGRRLGRLERRDRADRLARKRGGAFEFVFSRFVGALAHAWEERQSRERNHGSIPRHLILTYASHLLRRLETDR